MGENYNPPARYGDVLPSLHDKTGILDLQGVGPYGYVGQGRSPLYVNSKALRNTTGYFQGNTLPETEEFGFEIWFSPPDSTTSGCLAANGVPGVNGWELYLENGVLSARSGSSTMAASSAAPMKWNHAALVRTQGVSHLYLNGIEVATSTGAIPVASGHFAIAGEPAQLGGASAGNFFSGHLDDARYFQITGDFSPSADLLFLAPDLGLLDLGLPDLLEEPAIDFGTIKAGWTVFRAIKAGNVKLGPSVRPLEISKLEITGPDADQFQVEVHDIALNPYFPWARKQITPTLVANTLGPKSANLVITTNDPLNPVVTIALTANVVAAPVIKIFNGAGTAGEPLTEDSPIQQFPVTALGTPSTGEKTFTIRNDGSDTLSLDSVSIGGPERASFSLTHPPSASSLAPGESTTFGVNFIPTGSCSRRGSVIIQSNSSSYSWFEIQMTGTTAGPALQLTGPSGEDLASGRPLAWGWNQDHITEVPADLGGIKAISSNLALRNDGTVTGWGPGGDSILAVPPGLTGVTAIATGFNHALALKSDGTVVAWGGNDYQQADVPAGLANVVAISAGPWQSFALKSDSTLVQWGNPYVISAIPSGGNQDVAALVDSDLVEAVVLKKDGTLLGWPDPVPAQGGAGQSPIVAATAAQRFSLLQDGSLRDWDSTTNAAESLQVTSSPFVAIGSSPFASAALRADGSLAVAAGANSYGLDKIPAGLRFTTAVSLSGDTVITTLYDSLVNFGALDRTHAGIPQTFTLTNSGSSDLHLTGASLTGAGKEAYELDDSGLASTLAPGQSTTLTVALLPTAQGDENAALEIYSNDPGYSTFSVRLAAHVDVAAVSYDDWKFKYFGTTAGNGDSADDADPNGNGIPNLLE